MMNKDIIQGNWREIKGRIQKTWGKLTDDDVEQMEGSFEELQGILQKRYGYETDASKREIDEFINKNDLH